MEDGVSAKIQLSKMTEKNLKTGWEKRIRCAVGGAKDAGEEGEEGRAGRRAGGQAGRRAGGQAGREGGAGKSDPIVLLCCVNCYTFINYRCSHTFNKVIHPNIVIHPISNKTIKQSKIKQCKRCSCI